MTKQIEAIHKLESQLGITMTPGKYLRFVRRCMDMTQAELGLTLGVSRWTIYRIETGKKQLQVEEGHSIASCLHIDARPLIGLIKKVQHDN